MNNDKPKRGRPTKTVKIPIPVKDTFRYAVSLLFKYNDGAKTTTSLRSKIVRARSGSEALGKFYKEAIQQEDIKNAALELHTCIIIEDEES